MSDLSPAQAAANMGISRSAVYRAIADGDLVAYRVRGRLRIEPVELAAFKRRQAVQPRHRSGADYEPPAASRRDADGDSFASQLRAIRGGRAA